MLLKVTNAKYINDYKIELFFNDGYNGIVDLKNSIKGQVFMPLNDVDYFKTFKTNQWTIEWDCDADFAPEYLYDLIMKQSNKQVNKIYKQVG
ncbi:MAG: hypothetical protein B6I19_08895 [Bacteroidetes bacterium 4572_114]|nr:MAG: hypothetical protein B6I19_08895 [Bacteroidetes bacterium 4572_114]